MERTTQEKMLRLVMFYLKDMLNAEFVYTSPTYVLCRAVGLGGDAYTRINILRRILESVGEFVCAESLWTEMKLRMSTESYTYNVFGIMVTVRTQVSTLS